MFITRNIVKTFYQNWKKIFCLAVLLSVFFGVWEYRQYHILKNINQESEEQQDYQKILKTYDDAIKSAEDSIKITEEQVNDIQEYCDNSLYMQIDSQDVQVAAVRYIVSDKAELLSTTINDFVSYINGGNVVADIKIDSELKEEYLKELISVSSSGAAITVSVIADTEKNAIEIRELIRDAVEIYNQKLQESMEGIQVEEQSVFAYTRADAGIMNNQVTYLNSLKNYQSSLATFKKTLSDQEANKKEYIKYNEPEEKTISLKDVVKHMIFGFILGIGLAALWCALKEITGDFIKDSKDLVARGFVIFGKNKADVEKSVAELKLLAGLKQVSEVVIGLTATSDVLRKTGQEYAERLKAQQLDAGIMEMNQLTAADVTKLAEIKNCILVVELGNTTYGELEEQIRWCEKFEIAVWGCVVVE